MYLFIYCGPKKTMISFHLHLVPFFHLVYILYAIYCLLSTSETFDFKHKQKVKKKKEKANFNSSYWYI